MLQTARRSKGLDSLLSPNCPPHDGTTPTINRQRPPLQAAELVIVLHLPSDAWW